MHGVSAQCASHSSLINVVCSVSASENNYVEVGDEVGEGGPEER